MVRIIIGSKNDEKYLKELKDTLVHFHVPFQIHVFSCHRSLKKLVIFLDKIRSGDEKAKIIIAMANSVANLPAVIAGYIKDLAIPVIGIGLSGKRMNGIDSLLSVATIPKGIPLLNTGIDEVGVYNAALSCLNILAMNDKNLEKGCC